ncbi:MAG TPA: MOSC N-terminal beta barrel domain-containing protein [Verrucomicrobiae bacterium]|jgi:uncharacterized protein YcbX
MSAAQTVHVTGLNVFPVKSCRGIALREALLTARGLEHDREWMIVDAAGRFLTQRQLPRLALIETELTADALRLRAPGQGTLDVPLALRQMPRLRVEVWRHGCEAFDEGTTPAKWFSDFLGGNFRLVRFDPAHRRLSDQDETGGVEAENRFSDGYPLLVLSEESLAELSRRIGGSAPLPMNRFRPNLVITGAGPHSEDRARALIGDGIELRMATPCIRCRITTTDQMTAEVGKEPLRTLATYRRDEQLDGVKFGMNAIVINGAGVRLTVGMDLRVEQPRTRVRAISINAKWAD